MSVHVLGLCGSLRRGSFNRRLLAAAATGSGGGVVIEVFEHLGDLPPYSEDTEARGAPASVRRFREAIAAADAVLIATPEYNGSVPGQLKNALDWASRPYPGGALADKPAAVVGASTGSFGAVWAQAEVRKVLRSIGARVLDSELLVARADDAFTPDDRLVDPELSAGLHEIVDDLVHSVPGREMARCA